MEGHTGTSSAGPVILNAITDSADLVGRMTEALGGGREVLLIAARLGDDELSQLEQLARRHGYSPPAHLPQNLWQEYKTRLNLSDMAVKEQGITQHMLYLFEPASA